MNKENLPTSKMTAATLAGVMISLAATVAAAAGFEFNLNPEVALWIATGVMGLVQWVTREKRIPQSLLDSIRQQKVDPDQINRLRDAIDVKVTRRA